MDQTAVTPIALDTNAYSAMRHGDPEISEVFRRADRLLISTVVAGELISGFDMGSRSAANREALSRFLALPRVTLVPPFGRGHDYYQAASQALLKPSVQRWRS